MSINNIVKRLQDIMRNDAGINGDAQRIEQMVWILFLKVYDAKEEQWEMYDENFTSIIPQELRWRNWAVDKKDGKAITGEELLNFINNELFPSLKNLEITENTLINQSIVKSVFEDNNNYMKDGILLRQVVNVIDDIDFEAYEERHAFGEMYETILKDLQSAGNAGEFYTPRALTDFMAQQVNPRLGDKIADFACGTGGFLTSALKCLDKQVSTPQEKEAYNTSVFGIEKKALPYLLCVTNMLLHDIDYPNILHDNSLETRVQDYKDDDKFDIILMNPPYGGNEKKSVQINFPADLRGSETADLFMTVIMYRLKDEGRAAVVIPDGFLFGTEGTKRNIKEKLFREFNIHTILRLPKSVFAPYTSIATNVLFFDNNAVGTKETWFYRMDIPADRKAFSKTKPISLQHFSHITEWWDNRTEITDNEGNYKSKKFTRQEIVAGNYNLDLCGFPHKVEEILEPMELIRQYQEKRADLNAKIDSVLQEITSILQNPQTTE